MSVVIAGCCRSRIHIRVAHVGSIHVRAGSGIHVDAAVYVSAINIRGPVRIAVAVAISVCVSVSVVVGVFGFGPLRLVLVCVGR